jgi:DNA-binding IclR family transcriptional regulator
MVQSIKRAFAILQAVAEHPDGIGVTALADEAGLHKSTVSRLLSTLEGLEAVKRRPQAEGFAIGDGILALISQMPYPRQLMALVRPYLLELAEATGESVGLSVPDGDDVHYIDQVQSEHHVQVRDWTGQRFPMHVVTSGKLYLAYRSEAVLARYLQQPLARYTAQSVTDPAELRQRINQAHAQGYDWAVDEFEAGLTAVSAPIFGSGSRPIAAIYMCGPNYRFPPAGQQDRITSLITETAQNITARLAALEGGVS